MTSEIEKNEFFGSLKTGLEAAHRACKKGTRKDLRTTTLPLPPKELSAKEIADPRARLNVSQAVLARYLNISPKTVQSREQGHENPAEPASNSCQLCERILRSLGSLDQLLMPPTKRAKAAAWEWECSLKFQMSDLRFSLWEIRLTVGILHF